jgi:hypothetical protein
MSFHLREYVYSRIHDVEAVLQALNRLPCGLYSFSQLFYLRSER